MLNKRIASFALVLCLALIGDSLAQSRGQSSSKAPKPQQSATPDQRGTSNQPLSVNVVPTFEQKADAEKKDAEAKIKAADDHKLVEYAWYQVLIGIVTFCIFVLQLVAFSLQARYMRRTVIEMRRTTHAAIRSTRAAQKFANAAAVQARVAEEALTQLERPYIFIFDVKNTIYDAASKEFYAEYSVANYGKMPAIIEGAWIGFEFSDRGEPPSPTLMEDSHTLLVSPIFQSGEKRANIKEYVPHGMAKSDITVHLPDQDFGFAAAATPITPVWNVPEGNQVFFRAIIKYRGPSSVGHETGSLWLADYPSPGQIAQRGGDQYNYIK
jgi:hypothetical protein